MNKQKVKVLVVDDDERVHDFLTLALNEKGFQTTSCTSAAQASIKLKNDFFDLLLVDIQMPKRSGLDLVLELRLKEKSLSSKEIPVIVMSGYVAEHEKSIQNFTNVYSIEKPFDTERLIHLITKTLEEQSLKNDPAIEKSTIDTNIVISNVGSLMSSAIYITSGRVQVYDENDEFVKEVDEGNFLFVGNAISKKPVNYKVITLGEVSIFKIPAAKIAEEILKNKKWLQTLFVSGFSKYDNLK